ncbi:MAG: hypothetical protein GXY15_14715 [Candidatus Hydrogenedentes bacterium]|nr:hypothetical protein [Candidatus Hydrogenedentota bacterium]
MHILLTPRTRAFAALCCCLCLAGLAAAQTSEEALIAALSGDAPFMEKQAACRALRQTGTPASVPALAALLADPQLSNLARYALEPMPFPEAGAALRGALGTTSGALQAGVATSLAVRRDAEAVAPLAALMAGADPAVAGAATAALGRIATKDALQALQDAAKGAAPEQRAALGEALLCLADIWAAEQKGEAAAGIFEGLLGTEWPDHVRLGAFRGRTLARPGDAPERLLAAVNGDEPLFREFSAQMMVETAGDGATDRYAAALDTLPAEAQVRMLRGLAGRGDVAARPAVLKTLDSADPAVRMEAVRALAVFGDAADTPRLTALLGGGDAVAAEAEKSLDTMAGDAVDQALAAFLPQAAPGVHATILGILSRRAAPQGVALALDGLKHADPAVRAASLGLLAEHGGAGEVPACLEMLAAAAPDARGAVEKTLGSISVRNGDPALAPVLAGLAGPDAALRGSLVRVLAQAASPAALNAVVTALEDADGTVSEEALRALSEWRTLDALPPLRALAAGADEGRHILGLRGFIRLAQTESDLGKRQTLLDDAATLVKRVEERRMLLAAWGKTPTAHALDQLTAELARDEARDEAAAAVITLAPELAKQDAAAKERVKAALALVSERAASDAVRERAAKVSAALQ